MIEAFVLHYVSSDSVSDELVVSTSVKSLPWQLLGVLE